MHVKVVMVVHQGVVLDVAHFKRRVVVNHRWVTVMALAGVTGVGAMIPAVITVSGVAVAADGCVRSVQR